MPKSPAKAGVPGMDSSMSAVFNVKNIHVRKKSPKSPIVKAAKAKNVQFETIKSPTVKVAPPEKTPSIPLTKTTSPNTIDASINCQTTNIEPEVKPSFYEKFLKFDG